MTTNDANGSGEATASGSLKGTPAVVEVVIDVLEWQVDSVPVRDHRGEISGDKHGALLRLRSGDGAEGHCFIGGQVMTAHAIIGQLERVFRPLLIGVKAVDRNALWSNLAQMTGHGTSLKPAWSVVDVALWDLMGKTLGVSVGDLLGRTRDSLAIYGTEPPVHDSAQSLSAEILRLSEQGVSAYKIHPGEISSAAAIALVEDTRDLVGDEIALMYDSTRNTPEEAIQVGRALDAARFTWFEDPLGFGRFAQTADLARRIDTPIAVSDSVSFGLPELAHSFSLAPSLIGRGTSRWLGITGLMKAGSVAESHGRHFEIGLGGNPSFNAANIHVALSSNECRYYEHWLPVSQGDFGVDQSFEISNGRAIPSELPGLGVEIAEDWVRSHTVSTTTWR
jgi:L-alanine-DL-glutamate epimerase-like enolase superfamily enzyme